MGADADAHDLATRWAKARRAAVAATLGTLPDTADESDLLDCAMEVDAPALLRQLFDVSHRLGAGFARFHGRRPSLEALGPLLTALDSPCLRGAWEKVEGEAAISLSRPPCRSDCSARVCDAWREATDGLVVGLTGELRHARHGSRGHGDATCLDVVYTDPESELRFGVLGDELLPALEAAQALVRRFKDCDVRFLGVSEGVLAYELRVGCDGHLGRTRELLEQALRKRLPSLTPRDLTPRPVLDASGAPTSPVSPGDHP